MKKKSKGEGTALFSVIVIVLCVGISWIVESRSCSSIWNKAGLEHSWGPIQGCMIKTKKGDWIPADSYRTID